MAHRRFCPGCGEEVDVYEVEIEKGKRKERELRCVYCGLSLEWIPAHPIRQKGTLIIAEDTSVLAAMIQDFLNQAGIFKAILTVRNGGQFLETAVQTLRGGYPPRLAILDIRMPVLNGPQTAIAYRWIERGFGVTSRTPILFLSVLRIDETLKKVLEYCAPASYIHKGSARSHEELLQRVHRVAAHLITRYPVESVSS